MGFVALEGVDKALEALRDVVERALRAEQLRDRLTKLPNDESLTEWLQERVDEKNTRFWVAFVEVDRFKSINDKYGYESADELLRRIAERLRLAARDYFPTETTPFRAHGDEFFLAGPLANMGIEDVHESLDRVRGEIEALRVEVREKDPMRCTVSIGWLALEDSMLEGGLAARRVRSQLEATVDEAKVERNRVVKFSPGMDKRRSCEGRADCPACRAKIVVTVPIDTLKDGPLRCPNCGEAVDRPLSMEPRA